MFRLGNFGRLSPRSLGALPQASALATLAGLRVLVVDDNALNREVASDFLHTVGMQVVLAANGLQALDCLAQADFHMVLMDLQMPVMDGLAASREIRKQARWADLPLIALSAHDAQAGRLATVAAGMDAYLGKPIDEAALYQTLLQFVPPPRAAGGAPSAEIPLPDMLPGLDLRLAVSRLGGRQASLQRVLRGFVRDFAHLSAQWLPPVGPPPRQALAEQVHILKSTARYLGADALADAAIRLEQLAPQATPESVAQAVAELCLHLDTLLHSVECLLADQRFTRVADAVPGPLGGGLDVAALLSCIAQAQPLVAQGNYAATELLAEIRARLARTALVRVADAAWVQFEDLDLSAASATLVALASALADPPKES